MKKYGATGQNSVQPSMGSTLGLTTLSGYLVLSTVRCSTVWLWYSTGTHRFHWAILHGFTEFFSWLRIMKFMLLMMGSCYYAFHVVFVMILHDCFPVCSATFEYTVSCIQFGAQTLGVTVRSAYREYSKNTVSGTLWCIQCVYSEWHTMVSGILWWVVYYGAGMNKTRKFHVFYV